MNRKQWQLTFLGLGIALAQGCLYGQTSSLSVRELNQGWQFRSLHTPQDSERVDWHAAVVPGEVQEDLLRYGLIPDPNYGLNEPKYQWAGLSDWEYRTTFTLTQTEQARKNIDLVFDGLDTFADVFLNGTEILHANNMFRQWRVPAKDKLRPGDNELRIVFHSPVMTLLDKIKTLPYKLPTVSQVQDVSEEGIATDPYTRKAPYQYGWDFNPRLLTQGVWQPIRLVAWDGIHVGDFYIHQRHISKTEADFDAELTIDADNACTAVIDISHRELGTSDQKNLPPASHVVEQLHPGVNHISIPGSIRNPHLWWPNGYGPQSMYRFDAVVRIPSDVGRAMREIGFRSVELQRRPDAWGKNFAFVVNGIPIFVKGASVVPIDVFPTRITRDRLERMLEAARDVNMNMVRVWGGGIYEPDSFYEICDHLGLMVWQEFMFGGAEVPSDTAFRENVRKEARYQVKRLRNHPSIVLWCGNNETELKFYQPRITQHYTEAEQSEMFRAYLLVFSEAIKSAVSEMAAPTPYWGSSPSAGYDQPSDDGLNAPHQSWTIPFQNLPGKTYTDQLPPNNNVDGDMHYWPVWYQNLPAKMYTKQFPRFMTEYGFESFPAMSTLRSFASPDQMTLDSATMTEHQKSNGARGNQTIESAVERDYGTPADFSALVYLSQVEQADAMKIGAEDFRRLRPRCMGSIFWELQDGWPDVYSSSIDYYERWKALQWYAKRFYAPLLISPWLHDGKIDIYAISDDQSLVGGTLRIVLMDFHGNVIREKEQPIDVPALSSQAVLNLDEQEFLGGQDPRQVFARVDWVRGKQLLSSNEIFFKPVKGLMLPKATIRWKLSSDGRTMELSSDTLARDVDIEFQDPDARPSDNFFDLLPGKPVEISVKSNLPLSQLQPHFISLTDALKRE